jgi:hypothetical protein
MVTTAKSLALPRTLVAPSVCAREFGLPENARSDRAKIQRLRLGYYRCMYVNEKEAL